MKNIVKSLAVFLVILAGSCDFIDPELNIDPNNPGDVSINLLLPQAQATWAYVQGGDLGRYVSCWTQHHSGQERQHQSIEVYNLTESDVNNAWGNIYSGALKDLDIILEKAEASESPHYAGIAKIMTALIMGNVVDYFNDVPFTDALQGAEKLKPSYDTGAEIYSNIQNILTDAIKDLQNPASTFKPDSKSDLIFGGDKGKWIAFARSLKARYLLHLSKTDGGAYGKVLTELEAGAIASNAGNAVFKFGSAETEANPWYQFESQRSDVVMGKFFIDLMKSTNDPRLPLFATTVSGEYVGAGAGVFGNISANSRFGPYFASAASPVPLATFAEAKFMEAEAAFPTDKARSAKAFNDAVAASLEQFGLSDAAFLAAQASETASTISMEKIMKQKYIAMYTMLEPFTDWRRTGLPNLQPAQGESQIARRFPYAQDERVYNGSNYIPNITVFDRVFWDK